MSLVALEASNLHAREIEPLPPLNMGVSSVWNRGSAADSGPEEVLNGIYVPVVCADHCRVESDLVGGRPETLRT